MQSALFAIVVYNVFVLCVMIYDIALLKCLLSNGLALI